MAQEFEKVVDPVSTAVCTVRRYDVGEAVGAAAR